MLELAEELAADAAWRQQLVQNAHAAAAQHSLEQQLIWRQELYRHVWRLMPALDRELVKRWPELKEL